jgi:hypothetical protein
MQLLSERGFNRHIYPIIPYRGRDLSKEYYVKKDPQGKIIFMATKDSRWNLRCYKFMDYLSTLIRKQFDDWMVQSNPGLGLVTDYRDPRLSQFSLYTRPDNMYYILKGMKSIGGRDWDTFNPYNKNIRINYKEVAKALKWEKKHVKTIVEMISNYKFRTKYEFKTVDVDLKTTPTFKANYNNLEYKTFESIFNAEIGVTNKYKDGDDLRFLDRGIDDIDINFRTGFGVCFIHNIFTGGYQLINEDEPLYNLSESTQIIYRDRFFTFNKMKHIYLNDEWICNKLGITTNNVTAKKNIIKKIIDELSNIEKINFDRICNNGSYQFSIGKKKKSNVIPLRQSKV